MVHTSFQSSARRARALGFSSLFSLCACASAQGTHPLAPPVRSTDVLLPMPAALPSEAVTRGAVLERSAFVRAVLARNPSIEAARQGWRAALARVRQSGTVMDPMVELQLAPLSIPGAKAALGYEVMVSQTLPWFGKRSLDSAVASAEAEAAKSDLEGTRRELALTALQLYDRYFVAYRSLEINTEHLKLMVAMRDAASAQLTAGLGSVQDALQAEAELTHMEHDAVILASERDVLVAQMNELLHRPPEAALPPPTRTLPTAPTSDLGTAQLQEQAVRGREDIAAAQQRARAASARADRADRDAYPDVTVSTSYNSMWDMPEHRWMVGVGLNLPIFSSKRGAVADEARAMQAQFQSDAARLSDKARTQAFVIHKQLQESEHVLRLFDTRLLPIARERIDAARASFVTGQTPFMAVIAAEKDLRSVELEYQMAIANYAGRQGELERALGKLPGINGKEGEP